MPDGGLPTTLAGARIDRVARDVERAAGTPPPALRIERVRAVERLVGAARVAQHVEAEEAERVPGVGVLRLQLRRADVEDVRCRDVPSARGGSRARPHRLHGKRIELLGPAREVGSAGDLAGVEELVGPLDTSRGQRG